MRGKGFTLVELMVTVTIMAILASISFTIYAQAQQTGRDSKRKADLSLIQSALEQYHADQHYYPEAIIGGSPLDGGGRNYMRKIPTDPSGASYFYQAKPTSPACTTASGTCFAYVVCAQLEGTVASDTCTESAGHNYGVFSP